MAQRRIELKVIIDLAKGSKEAHEVTIKKIAEEVGWTAVTLMEKKGYSIRQAHISHLLHYVRHDITKTLVKAPAKRLLKMVG